MPPAGTWWLGAQPRIDFDPGNDYWFWETVPSQSGNKAAYRNPGDGFGTGCTAFALMADCAPNVDNPDVSFRLEEPGSPASSGSPSRRPWPAAG